jgi:hypothetical protein
VSAAPWIVAGVAAVAVGRLALGGRSTDPPTSWSVPREQQVEIDRLNQVASLYAAGHASEARGVLADRYANWDLIRSAAQWSRDPHARRIAGILTERGPSAFVNELHRQAAVMRNAALDALIAALNDYTGPTDTDDRNRS